LALPACGSESSAAPETSTATTIESRGEKKVESPPPRETKARSSACAGHLNGFLDQLEHLRRNLAIGVSYEQYVAELGTVRRSYEAVPVADLDLACLSGAAASAESAFDGYLAAANTWGDCVSDAGCETAALEPELQHLWRLAANQLAAARQALEVG